MALSNLDTADDFLTLTFVSLTGTSLGVLRCHEIRTLSGVDRLVLHFLLTCLAIGAAQQLSSFHALQVIVRIYRGLVFQHVKNKNKYGFVLLL